MCTLPPPLTPCVNPSCAAEVLSNPRVAGFLNLEGGTGRDPNCDQKGTRGKPAAFQPAARMMTLQLATMMGLDCFYRCPPTSCSLL